MTIIYLLIPLSLVLVAAAIGAFFWAVRSGQFDDLHTPALKILDDDEVATANSFDKNEAQGEQGGFQAFTTPPNKEV